jgi:hypothetical protein
MSGYTAEAIAQGRMLDLDVNFPQKPFHLEAFSRKIRMVLDGQKN